MPAPLADVLAYPDDDDAVAALRIAVRKILAADPQLRDEVNDMLAAGGVSIVAVGDRSIAAQQIAIAATGDGARITR